MRINNHLSKVSCCPVNFLNASAVLFILRRVTEVFLKGYLEFVMEGLQASSSQLGAAALGAAEEGLGLASGPKWKWDQSLFQPTQEQRQEMRPASWSRPGEKKAEFYSNLGSSAEMLSICNNLD